MDAERLLGAAKIEVISARRSKLNGVSLSVIYGDTLRALKQARQRAAVGY